jgi:hypothetical protein
MNDKELLKYAAMACQWAFEDDDDEVLSWVVWGDDNVPMFQWNPLKDDGDALRLAVKLRIVPACGDEGASTYCERLGASWSINNHVPVNGDKYAATRRAIVRAAAEIGKSL